jgi:ferrous iron transport protein A
MKAANELTNGENAVIVSIDYQHPSAKRLIELGFTPGQEIQLIGKSFFNDPLAFSIRGTVIAVRKSEASCIKVR